MLGDGAGKPMTGDAHAHVALDNGEHFAPTDREQGKRRMDHGMSLGSEPRSKLAYFPKKRLD